jgi:hypothetical protein
MAVWHHLGASATNRPTFHLSISGSSGGNYQYAPVAEYKPSSCIRKMKLANKKKQHCLKINSSK